LVRLDTAIVRRGAEDSPVHRRQVRHAACKIAHQRRDAGRHLATAPPQTEHTLA
jgi:hypothetical protein